jgi:hypothetical protein
MSKWWLFLVLALGCGAQVQLDSSDPAQLIKDGIARQVEGDIDGAEVLFETAVAARAPDAAKAIAYRGLGMISTKRGDAAGVVRWFEKYLPFSGDERSKVEKLVAYYGRRQSLGR